MSQGDGTPPNVELLRGDVQLASYGDGGGGVRLVVLEEVEVLDCHVQPLEERVDRGYGSLHDVLRRDASRGVSEDPRHGLQVQPLCLLLGGDYQRRCPVAQLGGVTGSDQAALLEDWRQLRKHLEGGIGPHALVNLEAGLSLRAFDGDWHDLVLEGSRLDGVEGLHVALVGELVCLLAGDAVLLRDDLPRDAHVEVVEGVPEGVVKHGILDLFVAVTVPPAGLHQQVGRAAHALHPACDDDLLVARPDGIGGQGHRLEARGTDLVDSHRPHLGGDPCSDGGLTGGSLSNTRLYHVAHDDLFDLVRLHVSSLNCLPYGDGAEPRC